MRPTQIEFDLQLPASCTLVPLEVVQTLLSRRMGDVVALIECGKLSHAWDIGGRRSKKREIRVWRESLRAYMANPLSPAETSLSDDAICHSLFGHSREIIRSTELQDVFACSQPHITNLIEAGLIDATGWGPRNLPMATRPPGTPNGFARVTRGSIIRFLQTRRVAAATVPTL